ncbi:hypothetical protein JCM1841_001990 [Sporobolomyces salmonicolor]
MIATGWEWAVDGATKWSAGVGYLRRQPLRRRFVLHPVDPAASIPEEEASRGLVEEDDAVIAPDTAPQACDLCVLHLSICWSPTYGVPVLWFEAFKSSGAPLALDELASSTIFQRPTPSPSFPLTTLAPASAPSGNSTACTPFLSQTDHPATGRPSWFVHPCETEGIVWEVISAAGEDYGGEGWEEQWLSTWAMVVGSVVDLRE